ncbi:MAG: UvrD-helicase domain-containing protein, partial [Isosphaeraceae bacterium]
MTGEPSSIPEAAPPTFTPEQRRPLEVRGASVALSAGAGCGKTTVLTGRFLGALDAGPEALRTIVAVTFTEKAARELRQRIRAACHLRLRQGGENADDWLDVLRGLEAAPVSTFHTFCAGLLRRHALDARVDPDFETLDALIASSVRDESVGRFVRQKLADKDDDLVNLAVEYGLEQISESLKSLVVQRDADRLADWIDRDDDEVLERWRIAHDQRVLPNLRRRLLDAGRTCAEFWRAESSDVKSIAAKRLKLLNELNDLADRIDDRDWLAEVHETAKMPTGVKKHQWPSPEVHKRAGEVLEDFRKAIKAWREAGEDDEDVSRVAARLGRMFARLGAGARQAYEEAKRDRGGLDFDDLLLKTRDLLREVPSVREAEGRAVTFVLVDEFQDTDPVQSEILRLLTGDGFADGRLFVVGDFKQSIYRFRGARPKLFHEYRASFPDQGRLELTENFRSVPGVIDFVNALFHEAFEGESGRLVPGRGVSASLPGERPAVTFVWPVADDQGTDEATEGKTEESTKVLRKNEAVWLARLIRSRIEEGWPIRDRKTREIRDAHPGDVAMLFKAMTDLAPYERALADEGLDYHVIGGSAFYAQDEVTDLINVLSVIEDPFDGIALAGALRSPVFGLSDDAIYWLGAPERGALAPRFLGDEARDDLPAADRPRVDRARSLLDRWRAMKDRIPIGDLVDRVLEESGYEPALLGEFLGDRKRANARKLVRMAREFDARGGITHAHYAARLRADLREPPKEEQAATT